MIRRIDLRGRSADSGLDLRNVVPRAAVDVDAAVEAVRTVCADVRHRGLEAVRAATARFDRVDQTDIDVPQQDLRQALDRLDPEVRAGLEESIRRLRRTCQAELGSDTVTEVVPGGQVRTRVVPVQRVGLYVPGGLAPLVSSVVMNVVPAQVAGVPEIAVSSPPQRDHDGRPHPTILAACALLGVEEVYAVGGAQAIAMFGYGAGPCRPVDLVTGPGNVYVSAAKRLLRGTTGIDTEAGPTEIAVLADETADPAHVAADLISQAEHDPLAAAVLVTDSEHLAAAVETEMDSQLAVTKHVDRIRTALGGQQSAVVLVDDLEHGMDVVEGHAAEHLEILTADAAERALRVRNAGAVFVGPHSPVSLGDYCAGSNHVLPTGGGARHTGGLSVHTFTKRVHVVSYDAGALAQVTPQVTALAGAEDLPAHTRAVTVRR